MKKSCSWSVQRKGKSLRCYLDKATVEPFSIDLSEGPASFAVAIIRTPSLVERLPVSASYVAEPENARKEILSRSLIARMWAAGLCPRPEYELKGVPSQMVPSEGGEASIDSLARSLRSRVKRKQIKL